MNLDRLIQQESAEGVLLRHRLHRIPELAMHETQTAAIIREQLTAAGIRYIAGVPEAPTATIAHIGDESRPCIALRADIDALPITESTHLAYASEHPGQMHACGHDGHTAILLTVAKVLSQLQDQLDVCVKLVFQPAEEAIGGARFLCNAGVLDGRIGPRAAAIFGLHGWPTLPVGTVCTRPGAIMAATDGFEVIVNGRGCHGAQPHMGRDPIVAGAEMVINLQQVISREIDPTDTGVVTVGKFHAGQAINIIPDQALLAGTIRSINPASRQIMIDGITRRMKGIAAAHDCRVQLTWNDGYPATINDPAMAAYVASTAQSTLGPGHYQLLEKPSLAAEDFAIYLQQTPGCFFFLGVCPESVKSYPGLHSDLYDFTDAALPIGVRMFVSLALNWSKRA